MCGRAGCSDGPGAGAGGSIASTSQWATATALVGRVGHRPVPPGAGPAPHRAATPAWRQLGRRPRTWRSRGNMVAATLLDSSVPAGCGHRSSGAARTLAAGRTGPVVAPVHPRSGHSRLRGWGRSRTRSFRPSFLTAFASRIGERYGLPRWRRPTPRPKPMAADCCRCRCRAQHRGGRLVRRHVPQPGENQRLDLQRRRMGRQPHGTGHGTPRTRSAKLFPGIAV